MTLVLVQNVFFTLSLAHFAKFFTNLQRVGYFFFFLVDEGGRVALNRRNLSQQFLNFYLIYGNCLLVISDILNKKLQ